MSWAASTDFSMESRDKGLMGEGGIVRDLQQINWAFIQGYKSLIMSFIRLINNTMGQIYHQTL